MPFLFLIYSFFSSLSFANPELLVVEDPPIYYGVDLDKIEELKHQQFQAHDIGWSGIGKEGLTRVYLAPNAESADLWIEIMKKRHYKSKFIELEDHADYTLWDEEQVIISQFGLLMILVQGERIEERRDDLQALFIEEGPVTPSLPEIRLTETGFQLKIESPWEYSFVGGKPIYTSTMIEFIHLPETITVWNRFAQSYRFQLQKEPQKDGVLLFYEILPDEVPILEKKTK